MKQAIIFHGMPSEGEYMDNNYPSASNSHWLPWLQKQLLTMDWFAHTPEVKDAYKLDYPLFLAEVKRYNLDKETTLIGHSSGAGFLVKYLQENPEVKIEKLILVAPWFNDDKTEQTDVFDFELDKALLRQSDSLVVLYSVDDHFYEVGMAVERLKKVYPDAKFIEFEDKGHFVEGSMGGVKFPEMLKEVLE